MCVIMGFLISVKFYHNYKIACIVVLNILIFMLRKCFRILNIIYCWNRGQFYIK